MEKTAEGQVTGISARFVPDRVTKNTIRYTEVGEEGDDLYQPIIGTIYIQKSALKRFGSAPEEIIVQVGKTR